MSSIGTPDEYIVQLVNGLTDVVLYEFPWSQITWSRVRNDVSSATVTVPAEDGGIECCRSFGMLKPWEQLLVIYRNGARVWDGPVIGWSRPAIKQGGDGRLTIRALDRFAITYKRLCGADRTAKEDPGSLFYNILNQANIGNLGFGPPYIYTLPSSGSFVAKPANKVDAAIYVSRLERVYDAITALVQQGAVKRLLGEVVRDRQGQHHPTQPGQGQREDDVAHQARAQRWQGFHAGGSSSSR